MPLSAVALATVLLLLVHTAPSALAANYTIAKPGCNASCGGVDIPYPFGIGDNCYHPGFEIICNATTNRPALPPSNYEVLSLSTTPKAEARLQLPIAWQCYNTNGTYDNYTYGDYSFNPDGVYRISDTHNELVIIGCNTVAWLESAKTGTGLYSYNYYTGCVSFCNSSESVTDGQCNGLGCCKVDIAPGLTENRISFEGYGHEKIYNFSRCSYGFLVDRDSYNFSRADLNMSQDRAMPVWVDWAIRSSAAALTCVEAQKNKSSYACVSQNSGCNNSINGPGYTCSCSTGYEGNPYIFNGCQDIDECNRTRYNDTTYPCQGNCINKEGYYECNCPAGYRSNDASHNPCTPKFPRSAQLTVGITLGVSFLIVLLIVMLMVHEKRKLREFFKKNGGPLLAKVNNIKIFTQNDLNQITKNYSTVLGKGGFGEVYLGIIDNSQQVAVKRSITIDEARKKEFANEVIIQSQISHKNVVRLVGCCLEVDVPMLVYEFAPKGSLYDVLHGSKNSSKIPLFLENRLDIAIDSAEALAYMHTSTAQKILHGDVKYGNILLDDKFMAKVSDFGTARLLSIEKDHTRFVIGDMNYIDPVYMKTGLLTEKSDVYSFGVVLLELFTGKKTRYDGNNSLVIDFTKSYNTENRAREMFDKEIINDDEDIECLVKACGIAITCLEADVDERPTMKQVAEYLQFLRKEWKQRVVHGQPQVDEISIESSPISLTMDTGSVETSKFSPSQN